MKVSETEKVFQAVSLVLQQNQALFNAADEVNHNHGDHMVEIFATALRAAAEEPLLDLPEQLGVVGRSLLQLSENGSARSYGEGLVCLSEQLMHRQISQDELAEYVRGLLSEQKNKEDAAAGARGGEILKALLQGLAGWKQAGNPQPAGGRKMDMGALFDLGIAYIQAKQRGGSRVEILADAAVSASPLSAPAHRAQSGRLVFQALLQALADISPGERLG